MKRYNPFLASLSAIKVELTSDRAINYYQRRAWHDAQVLVNSPFNIGVAIYTAAFAAYQMGGLVREWLDITEQTAITTSDPECTAIVPVQSASIVIKEEHIIDAEIIEEPLLLTAFTEFAPRVEQAVAFATGIREALERAIALEFCAVPALAAAYCGGFLPAAPEPVATPKVRGRKPKKRQDSAAPAPRKSPTLARVGKHVAAID